MKIGTITFFRANYGAILQAYALQTTLESLGHSPQIIDYQDPFHSRESLFDSWTSAKSVVLNLFTVLRYGDFIERKHRMAKFYKQFLHISKKKYYSSGDIEKDISKYNAFICGSDMIWCPLWAFDPVYYLGFVKQHQAIKISYAPSFGVSTALQSYEQEICPWIKDIHYLSVREETGRDMIEQATGRQSAVVLDPTLLLDRDQFNRIARAPEIMTPYILVYSTSQRGLFSELVSYIKKTTRLPVVVLSLTSLNLIPGADRVIYNAGPSEFISLFANATCICTNAFHGVAFSIIYRKPFWSVPLNSANSRIADLLRRIGLSHRQISGPEQFPKSPLDIDYTIPASLLGLEKHKSVDFLKNSLQRL